MSLIALALQIAHWTCTHLEREERKGIRRPSSTEESSHSKSPNLPQKAHRRQSTYRSVTKEREESRLESKEDDDDDEDDDEEDDDEEDDDEEDDDDVVDDDVVDDEVVATVNVDNELIGIGSASGFT